MSLENLSEGKLPYNFHKSKKMKKLGIILEENNNNNSEFEKSLENSSKNNSNKKNVSFINKSINFKNISFTKENKENDINNESLIKYKTQKSFFNKRFFYDILNDDKNNIISDSNKKINKKSSDKNLILNDSGKKPGELINLISNKNSDKIKNENYTKNINLNININNNIQYEIEKSKEKEDDNSELNKSLNSLIKIAEKNCLYFSDTIQSDIYDINKNKEKEDSKNNNNKINNEEIKLSSNKEPAFMKVHNNKMKKKEINRIQKDKANKSNNIKTENLIPTGNNINIKDNIYNKKKSIPKNISFKTNRNLSFKLKNNEENVKIYKRIKNSSKNYLSIGKNKEKNTEGNDNKIMEENNMIEYKRTTYNADNINKINPINKQAYSRNTFNENNSKKMIDNNILMNKKFFEVNISLDNCFRKFHNFESNIDDDTNKIYKRPTIFINPIKKVRSLDKVRSNKDIFKQYSSRENNKINYKSKRTKTNTNIIINSNKIKNSNTYVKKSPQNPVNISINNQNIDKINNHNSPLYSNNIDENNIIYFNKKSRNQGIYKERNTINTYNKSNFNIKKYEDIYNNSHTKNIFQNNRFSFSNKLGDLIILEEKLCDAILGLKKNKRAENQCLDFLNFYYNFSMYKQLEKLFDNEVDEEIVRLSLNYELISIILCYKFSKENEIIDTSPFLEILQLCHRNLINIYEQVLKEINKSNNNLKNIWVQKLGQIVDFSKQSSEQLFPSENYITSLVGKINFNTNSLIKKLKNILYNNKYQNKNIIINFIKSLNQRTFEEIYIFFKEYIYLIDNPEGSILPEVYKLINQDKQYQNYPYIKLPNKKRYTLILDLNETLISLKYANNIKGLIRVRPFLYDFLDVVGQYYELILFTGSSENYTKSIVEALERKKKYFDFIFYRQYLVKCGDCYIKDLSKIGRPLNSTIIIDNNPQNYKLQKENGICIKSFWGDDPDDIALYNLIDILINIVKEKVDVRDGLSKYRDEIVSKVSVNIS